MITDCAWVVLMYAELNDSNNELANALRFQMHATEPINRLNMVSNRGDNFWTLFCKISSHHISRDYW